MKQSAGAHLLPAAQQRVSGWVGDRQVKFTWSLRLSSFHIRSISHETKHTLDSQSVALHFKDIFMSVNVREMLI